MRKNTIRALKKIVARGRAASLPACRQPARDVAGAVGHHGAWEEHTYMKSSRLSSWAMQLAREGLSPGKSCDRTWRRERQGGVPRGPLAQEDPCPGDHLLTAHIPPCHLWSQGHDTSEQAKRISQNKDDLPA